MVEHTMHTLWWHAHQVLYPTEGSPAAAAIMSCGLISKLFESSLWLKYRGSCVRECGVIYEGTPLISSTFSLGTFFRRLAFIVKSKLLRLFFVCIFCFVLLCLSYTRDYIDYEIKVSITVTPHKHHGVSEQRQPCMPCIETFAEFLRSATVCSTAYSG